MEAVTYTIVLESFAGSDYMCGKAKLEDKGTNETSEQFELRSWKQKIGTNDKGEAVLNEFALKNALEEAASRLRMKVPGQGKSEYKKLFVQGIVPCRKPVLCDHSGKPYTPDDFEPRPLFVPVDGKKGSGKRVYRIFPTVSNWMTEVSLMVMDPKIDANVLEIHLKEAGMFIGLGSMRVSGGGVNGRFIVKSIKS